MLVTAILRPKRVLPQEVRKTMPSYFAYSPAEILNSEPLEASRKFTSCMAPKLLTRSLCHCLMCIVCVGSLMRIGVWIECFTRVCFERLLIRLL
jgi:hypothetical protein